MSAKVYIVETAIGGMVDAAYILENEATAQKIFENRMANINFKGSGAWEMRLYVAQVLSCGRIVRAPREGYIKNVQGVNK